MKTTEHGIVDSRYVENMHHMRLMALLQELVRKRGPKGAARVLEIDPKTVTSSMRSGQLTRRVRDALERALQEGIGSAADRQRRRNEKLEAELKELKEELRGGLKRLRMSLDGVRKYYSVQRRLIDQRLLALEAGREGAKTGASTGDESGGPGSRGSQGKAAARNQVHVRVDDGA